MESPAAYIPVDRRLAIAHGQELPDHSFGATLFADISGFTPLTEALVRALGPQRGAEELPRQLNLIYDALITEVDRYGGSVIGFAGDAITCWFPDDDGHRATACALAIQQTMQQFASVRIPGVAPVAMAIKVAVATGAVRRFLVGDPKIQVVDVLAGETLQRLAAAEHEANKGEVLVDAETLAALADQVEVVELRTDAEKGSVFAVIRSLAAEVAPLPWPPLAPDALSDAQVSPWLLPPVYERLRSGMGEFLTELRPAVPLFMRFGGIDYDEDEAAGAHLDAFIRWVQGILDRYGGFLIQLTIGDKGSFLYAAFGAPLAHDNDAARAVAAALELRALPPELAFIQNVQIGISHGRMRTGAYGGTSRRTYGVLGDEVNLAARLMQNAPIGEAIVSQYAQKAAGDAFMWEALPPLRVKGKSQPITVFQLLGRQARPAVRMQEPRYALPMVGRAAELDTIAGRLDQAIAGHGQIVAITAEAGMGKSRLMAEVVRLALERQLPIYAGECQSYGTNSSYLVWEGIWRSFFELDASAPAEEQVRAIEQYVGGIDPTLVARVPLLGIALNLPIPDNDLTAPLDAKLRKASLEALLVDCVRARASSEPVMFVLEDCHWIDPLSNDLLEAIGRAIADMPVVIAMAYRPPDVEHLYAASVTHLPYCTVIHLADFTSEEAARLIEVKLRQLMGGDGEIPAALVERITTRAQGNPFYIEELLNYLRDRGIDPHDTHSLEQLDLPSSLQSLILSRIDQLNEGQKITLKVASVVGRLFRFSWLWGVHPQLGEPARVRAELESMSGLDLTPLDQPEPELTYLFKHIMTREVAYESLPFATRGLLHDHLGQFIEDQYAGMVEQYLDLLAYHYSLSQNESKKREYFRKAGEAAQAAYANTTAIDYYQRLLPLLPEGEQVPVMLQLGQVLELVGEWGETEALYRKAWQFADQLLDPQAQARCETALGDLLRKRGEYAEATQWLQRARAQFEALGDLAGVAQTLHTAGTLANQQGDHASARTLYEQSLAIRRDVDDKRGIANLFNNLGIVAYHRGEFSAARALYEESLVIRRELNDKAAIAVSLNNLGLLTRDQGDLATAYSFLDESLALARELGHKWLVGNALNNLGQAARDQGNYVGARTLLEESLSINRELGDRDAIAYLLEDFGALAAVQAQPERALQLAGAAAGLRDTIGTPLSPAEQANLDRMLALARQVLGEASSAVAWEEGRAMTLEQAIDYALNEMTPA